MNITEANETIRLLRWLGRIDDDRTPVSDEQADAAIRMLVARAGKALHVSVPLTEAARAEETA